MTDLVGHGDVRDGRRHRLAVVEQRDDARVEALVAAAVVLCRVKVKRVSGRRSVRDDDDAAGGLTPFFSQTPPAFLRSPVQARPRVPPSKSR